MKQTAVEWLIEQLTEIHPKAFEQAKAMEKEQIVEAWNTGTYAYNNGEQYYKETFKSE